MHLEQVCPPEPSPESGLKIAGQAHDKLLSIASSFRPVLPSQCESRSRLAQRPAQIFCQCDRPRARSAGQGDSVRRRNHLGKPLRMTESPGLRDDADTVPSTCTQP